MSDYQEITSSVAKMMRILRWISEDTIGCELKKSSSK